MSRFDRLFSRTLTAAAVGLGLVGLGLVGLAGHAAAQTALDQQLQGGWRLVGVEAAGAGSMVEGAGSAGSGGTAEIVFRTSVTCFFTDSASCLPCSISSSMVLLRSSDAFLNSARPRPRDLPSSGSFFGPNTRRATTKIRINSGMPMEPNMFSFLARLILRRSPGLGETFGGRSARMTTRRERLRLHRSRLFFALALLAGATIAGGMFQGRLNASPERETPSLDEYADILTTLSDWAPEPIAPTA